MRQGRAPRSSRGRAPLRRARWTDLRRSAAWTAAARRRRQRSVTRPSSRPSRASAVDGDARDARARGAAAARTSGQLDLARGEPETIAGDQGERGAVHPGVRPGAGRRGSSPTRRASQLVSPESLPRRSCLTRPHAIAIALRLCRAREPPRAPPREACGSARSDSSRRGATRRRASRPRRGGRREIGRRRFASARRPARSPRAHRRLASADATRGTARGRASRVQRSSAGVPAARSA